MRTAAESLSIAGLGKLGLCMAGCLAEAGFPVIGVDIDAHLVSAINRGDIPYLEPELDRVLANTDGRLQATLSYRDAVVASDTTFIVVATPTQADGTYGNEHLAAALTAIAVELRQKERKHNIIVSCTVMPGTLESVAIPLLERISGKRLGEGFALAYNPEFIAMGDVIRIFKQPDFVLIGESEPAIGELLERIYARLCTNHPPVSRMSLINAELAKIALNCYVTTKITFANMVAELCERLPGADVDVVTNAIGQDSRIGEKVLRGGLGFGGPCFPRDNRAFARLAADNGMTATLAEATHHSNQRQERRLLERLQQLVATGATVALLGVAYKPRTPLIDESQALNLARRLAEKGYQIRVHDPLALANARAELGACAQYCDTIEAALDGADAAVVTLLADEYRNLTAADFQRWMNRDGVVFDIWRMYRGQSFDGLRYAAVGLGASRKEA